MLFWLSVAASGQALAGQACVYTDTDYQGEKRCFDIDARVDVPDGFAFKSVKLAWDTELVVSTGAKFAGQVRRFTGDYPQTFGTSAMTFSTFLAVPRACVYKDAKFQGRENCFAPGALEWTLSDSVDRNASSLLMAKDLAFYAFSDQLGRGESYSRYSGVNFFEAFNDKARSLQVVRTRLNCSVDCPVGFSEGYNLADILERESAKTPDGKRHPLSQVVMTVETSSRQDFYVYVGNALRINFTARTADIEDAYTFRPVAKFDLDADTAFVSIALAYDDPEHLDVQLVSSDRMRKVVGTSPIATVPRPAAPLGTTLAIDNESSEAIRIAGLSFALVKPEARLQPPTRCWHSEMLAVATYFLGQCSAPSLSPAGQDRDAIRYSAGAAAYTGFNAVISGKPRTAAPETRLVSYTAMGRNPMAVYAAARVCRAEIEHIATPRMRRGVDDPADCISRTMTIIALFQTLFGPQWDSDRFEQVMSSILTHGTTGYATSNPEVENQLIAAVQERDRTTTRDNRRQTAMAAYRAADQVFQVSRNGTMDMEVAAARMHAAGNGQLVLSDAAPATLAEAQSAPLGRYQIDLRTYQPQTVTPRVLRNGRWEQDARNPFTYEIHSWDNIPIMLRLSSVLQGWRDDYRRFAGDNALSPGQVSLAHTGRRMADSMVTSIAEGEPAIYVVVLYRGFPVSVLLGSIDEDDPTKADVGTVVSAPQNVLYRDSAVRGAASHGLQAYLNHLHGRGVTDVFTSAITAPSALVKQRAGFKLIEPLDQDDASSDDDARRRR
ncbi:hypothetical protein CYJ10_25540 [Cupriavidus pauculus]|uniref:Exotoxin n=1 Tax=Cupriavidus pauculus TaxID=82633 RepID=A0A2N5C6I7_9BURK|nr:hypothetical protein CYJ10_25540 [Cupriavidus pauculus]